MVVDRRIGRRIKSDEIFSFRSLFFWLFVCITSQVYGKHPELIFERIKSNSGSFPQNISKICQDDLGFIWIGSDNGLSRYDGYEFYDFRFSGSDSTSISNNIVASLFYDSYGSLWVGTVEGLNRMDLKTELFSRYYHESQNPNSIGDNLISPIYEDSKKNLWVGTYGGVSLYNRLTDSFYTYSHLPGDSTSLSHNTVSSFFEDSKGNLWVGTWGGGLNLFNFRTGKFRHFRHDELNSNSISHDYVSFVIEDKKGVLWVGTRGGGLNAFDPENDFFRHFTSHMGDANSLNDDILTSGYIDESGILWIGTWNGGLNLFDPDTETFQAYQYEPENPNSLISDCITFIFKDATGIIFIGTNKGVSKARLKRSLFDFHSNEQGKRGVLNSKDIRAIYNDNQGSLWLGTHEGGLNKINLQTGAISYYTFGLDQVPSMNKLDVSGIIDNFDGSFWINSIGHGLFKFYEDGRYEYFERYSKPAIHPVNDNVTFLFKDRQGLLWLGFPNGVISIVNPETDKISVLKLDSTIETKALLNEINYIVEDAIGNKWVAVRHKGLYFISHETLEIRHLSLDSDNENSLSDNDVFVLHISNDGILWIGTMNGLNRYEIKTETFKRYFIENGLSDNAIRSITEDNAGNLWLGTHNGLSRFDIANERFNNYDERDGVYIKQFNSGSFFSEKENELFLCGYNGYIRFNPKNIVRDYHKPKVYITGLEFIQQKARIKQRIFGQVILEKSILFTDTVKLSHHHNNFAILYTALHFKMSDKNQYAYKLQRYDKDWTYCGNERLVKYMNLPPGVYTFKVIASNSDGVWNESGDSLTIIISPPWWKTTGMFLFYSLFFIVSVLLYVKWKTAKHIKDKLQLEHLIKERTKEIARQNFQLVKQAEELKNVEEMRSRFYTYVSHEFRTPLTLIISPLSQLLSGFYADNVSALYKVMFRNANRLLSLVDELLDLAKQGKMGLMLSLNKLNPLIERILLVYKDSADQKGIEISYLQYDKDIRCYYDRDKIEKIFSNLLSNAIKYCPKGSLVTVEVSSSSSKDEPKTNSLKRKFPNGWIRVTVKDNGPGIEEEKLQHIFKHFYQGNVDKSGWGVGLALVRELVSLHSGEVIVDSSMGKGTVFSVFIPMILKENKAVSKENVSDIYVMNDIDELSDDFVDNIDSDDSEVATKSGEVTQSNKRFSVLVVEDNEEIRFYLTQLLKSQYNVEEAANGLVALDCIAKSKFDMVISDVMMPEMGGLELCQHIKTDINTCHIPVILLTAKTSDIDRIEGLEKGADDYLSKPFSALELKIRIDNLIELRQLLQRKYRQDVLLNPKEIQIESLDEIFLDKIRQIVEREIASDELTVDKIYTEMGFGRTTFNQKFKSLSGISANQFIRSYRLKRARQLLEQKAGNISHIAYEVGFTSTAYFTKCFKEEFGILPSDCN